MWWPRGAIHLLPAPSTLPKVRYSLCQVSINFGKGGRHQDEARGVVLKKVL